MGFGMTRGDSNPNLAGQPKQLSRATSVRDFAHTSGLDKFDGFPEYLETLASTRMDLAFLTDADWQQTLAPLDLKLGKARRVEAAIHDLRVKFAKEKYAAMQQRNAEQHERAEVRELQQMMSDGPARHRGDSAAIEPADPRSQFIPVAFFQGAKAGFVFKDGAHGLGYYRDNSAGGGGGGGGRQQQQQAALLGFDPISGSPLGHEQAQQLRAREQAVLQQRQQRLQQQQQQQQMQMQQMQMQMQQARTPQQRRQPQLPSPRSQARAAAQARLAASPFATG